MHTTTLNIWFDLVSRTATVCTIGLPAILIISHAKMLLDFEPWLV